MLAERYYHSDAAEYVDIQSATKSVISTLVGIASAALVQATGMSTLAYARRELFDPLGISSQPAYEGPIAAAGMFPRAAKRSGGARWAWFGLVVARSDEVGGEFGDHDGRRVGMAADDPGHH